MENSVWKEKGKIGSNTQSNVPENVDHGYSKVMKMTLNRPLILSDHCVYVRVVA